MGFDIVFFKTQTWSPFSTPPFVANVIGENSGIAKGVVVVVLVVVLGVVWTGESAGAGSVLPGCLLSHLCFSILNLSLGGHSLINMVPCVEHWMYFWGSVGCRKVLWGVSMLHGFSIWASQRNTKIGFVNNDQHWKLKQLSGNIPMSVKTNNFK